MNFDGLRVGGVELVFKKLPISGIWGYPVQNSRARGHELCNNVVFRAYPEGARRRNPRRVRTVSAMTNVTT